MSQTAGGAAEERPRSITATVNGDTVVLQRPSGRKAARALAELRQAGGAAKEITKAYGLFVREYEEANVIELDRVQARMEFPKRPVLDVAGDPVRDADGEVVLAPSVIDTMTEDDWERSGGKLRIPKSPSLSETIMAVLPQALELAEDRVYRLLALFLMPNEDVKRLRAEGLLDQELQKRADDLLDEAYADELVELAVAAGELVDNTFRRKAEELGDRLGNAMRLIGLGQRIPTTNQDPEPLDATNGASDTKPTSSTASPAPTETSPAPSPSSTSPTTSSPPSETASATTAGAKTKPTAAGTGR